MLLVDTQTQDITIDAGCQEKIEFTLTNTDGSPFNGTGCEFHFVVKESLDDAIGSAKININSTTHPAQFDLSQAASGIIRVELLPSNTSALGGKVYHYGLKAIDSGSKPHLPRKAFLTVRRNVAA